ncbi:MAG: FHA domain-containing protein [Vicinamibacterales bacterium]
MWMLRALDADVNHPLSFRLLAGAVKTIGRLGAADFCLDVPLVSRLHCRVEVGEDGGVEIVDLESTNGTWIDGERIARAQLRPGSILRVGRVAFALEPAEK